NFTDLVYDPHEANKERLKTLAQTCKQTGITYDLNKIYKKATFHLLYEDTHKFVFCLLPKVGTTTWKTVLETGLGKTLLRLSYIPQPVGLIKLHKYVKLVIARDPLERLLSSYYSKIHFSAHPDIRHIFEHKYGEKIMAFREGFIWETGMTDLNVTFEEFAKFVIACGAGARINSLNHHWIPQYILSYVCLHQYDFIGHFDKLAYDAPYAIQLMGLTDVAQFPPIHHSQGNTHFSEYSRLPLPLVKQLVEYYRLDYQFFSFDTPKLDHEAE
ncbi:carbohydrate sulfotransferase 14-like, partial [Saccoglossus kowalevskii]|uniref:Carbohydrate sulfotransferase n=1 Tax=Saccoglossus kowalevskii TaxID=10224 RepID=A0ABM0MNN1_SACKO